MNNQNKKVLLVITKSNFGGAQKYVFELAKSLKSHGMSVQVALGGTGILIQKLQDEGIEVINIPNLGRDISLSKDLKVLADLYKIIRKSKPDIVHLNSSKIGAIGALASRLAFVPMTVFTIHGWAFNEDRSAISKFAIRFIYLVTLLLCNRMIAVSNTTSMQARSIPLYPLFQHKIKTVYNGIEMPNFQTRDAAIDFFSSLTKKDLRDRKIVGQIAELHPVKSIDTTIAAAETVIRHHPETAFILIGDGEEKDALQKLIVKKGLMNNVFLVGFVDNAAQYLKAFDVFCLTSKSEALALALIEAGLARVPVIASRVGGIPELITHNETGFLFESGNVAQLASMIDDVLSLTPTKKTDIIENFYTKIQDNFLLEHMTRDTINLYRS